jgi:hypothetical protein
MILETMPGKQERFQWHQLRFSFRDSNAILLIRAGGGGINC